MQIPWEAGSVRFQKIVEKFGMSLGSSLTYKIVFFGLPGVSKKTQILKRFWHSFCDDFARPGNVKNEQKRGRIALFLIFGVCKISCRSGAVSEGSGGGFSELFGRFWLDFGALKRSPILKPKLEGENMISDSSKGIRCRPWAALILIVDQSIIGIIDH